MVHLQSVRFILRAVSRTYGQLKVPFGRQPRRYLRRDFLCISFVFYSPIKSNYGGYIQVGLSLSTTSI